MAHTRDTRVFEVEIVEIEALSVAVRRLILRPRGGAVMSYREGQFLCVLLPDGETRCYSMAGPCRSDGWIELHAHLLPSGKFSALLTETLRPGHSLRITGPFGDCVLQPGTAPDQTMVALATGTGVAPIKAMIERTFLDGENRPISLYWGGQTRDDLYLLDHFAGLQARSGAFRFIPVLAAPDDSWTGRRGFVQDAAAADFASLRSAIVYACGAPVMVDAARRLLTGQRALPPDRFHADAFEAPGSAAFPAASDEGAVHILATPARGSQTMLAGRIGTTLLDALKGAGLPVHGVCGGKKACGACRVRLDPPTPSQDRDELRLLASLDAPHPGDRLACQVRLHAGHDGLSVCLPASPF